MFCKPFLRLTVIQVDWKARRRTWSPRTSFTTRSSQQEMPHLQANRTAPGAQASLPPAWAKQRRARPRMVVGFNFLLKIFSRSDSIPSPQWIFFSTLMCLWWCMEKKVEIPVLICCICGDFCLQIAANISLIQPQSLWIKPTTQRPKWPPATGMALSTGMSPCWVSVPPNKATTVGTMSHHSYRGFVISPREELLFSSSHSCQSLLIHAKAINL